LWSGFEGPAAIIKRNDWIDRPSVSIAYSYLFVGSELAAILSGRGEVTAGDSILAKVRQVARAIGVERLLSDANPPQVPLGDTSR
jgi:hypothetical protein